MAKIIMAVIDCETNGLTTNYSVLSNTYNRYNYVARFFYYNSSIVFHGKKFWRIFS